MERKVKILYHAWQSPIGTLHFIADERALLALVFDDNAADFRARFGVNDENGENAIILRAKEELRAYFRGASRSFTVPIRMTGTDFQLRVWESLRQIPFGARKSYLDQARDLKMGSAVRAIASANGKNPICIIIPCHRVVRKDGSLGGYAGGVDIKSRLLDLELNSKRLISAYAQH